MYSAEAKKIIDLGYKVTENTKAINLEHNGHHVVFWKKSRWFSGKSVEDGRGLNELIKQLSKKPERIVSGYRNNPEAYNHLIGIFQKHSGVKLSEETKEAMLQNMMRRFDINIVNQ